MATINIKFIAATCILAFAPFASQGAETVNAYTTMPEKYADQVFQEFTKDTGIKVDYLRFSAGEALARLELEKKNPAVDFILGGPADIYTAGMQKDLFEPYKPKDSDKIPASVKDPNNYWTGVGLMPLCFVTNKNFLKKNNLKAPESWDDLLDSKYKNGLLMGDARTFGTATERIFSLVKAKGEDEAFEYQKKLSPNVQMYTKSGAWPALRVGTGQAASGIVYLPDALDIEQLGYPVIITYPKDGVTCGIEGIGLVKGAKNPEAAKKFMDWAASHKLAQFWIDKKINYVPTRTDIKVDNPVLDLNKINILPASTEWKGEKRNEYTERWINEVIPAK